MMAAGVSLVNLAVSLAIRLKADSEDFDPVRFLNACSPNVEKFPFGELWEIVEQRTHRNVCDDYDTVVSQLETRNELTKQREAQVDAKAAQVADKRAGAFQLD